ncbi:MAG TPA: heavy metal-binding domain-containing protein [Solirubrobacteraceae bacterium]|nr:heavy metal-binding domain-containing protein [Solirubrobacteraceae bacterium]
MDREQRESLERVERGGIPRNAERRLRELSEGAGAFTSDLSVGSFALCHELGLTPLAQVMGSSIYHVGYAGIMPTAYGGGFMYELETLSQAWNEARDRAFSRLAQEAEHVGADAVVGVQISSGAREFTEDAIEYVVVGTAVRDSSRRAAAPAGAGTLATELSVPDYAKLRRAGIETLGVVAWTSVFFVQSWQTAGLVGGLGGIGFTQNQELTDYTRGIYEAREMVMARVTAQAARSRASGVVGMRVDHTIRPAGQNGLLMSFNAIGTAVREGAAAGFGAPKTTIDLTEGATA